MAIFFPPLFRPPMLMCVPFRECLHTVTLTCSLIQNAKALLTIGGWTGSTYFSSAVGSAANRTAWVKTLQSLIQQYDLDGLDFECVA